jgi:hypothetical protein
MNQALQQILSNLQKLAFQIMHQPLSKQSQQFFLIVFVLVIFITVFFVIKLKKKYKIKQEKKRQELIKQLAEQAKQEEEKKRRSQSRQNKNEQKRKLDETNRLEEERIKKIHADKYETSKIVVVGQKNGKYTCVLERNNKTYAYIERDTTPYQLNGKILLLKETSNQYNWISESSHIKIQKEINEQKFAENAKKNLLQALEKQQRDFCENNTNYSIDIHGKYSSDHENFGLMAIKSLSTPFYNSITEQTQNRIFRELDQGVAILKTEAHLYIYMRSYSNMHQAKLVQSFQAISNLKAIVKNNNIQINDYGCGQGIGSIVFIDYLKSINASNFKISKVKLIEPSELALKRASLNVKYCLRSIYQDENVLSIHKGLDNINGTDILSDHDAVKFHIFSNIIDVESINLKSIYTKISETQKGINYFICVSPKFWDDGSHPRNNRLDTFMNYFQQRHNVTVISTRENNINSWTRYERVFMVNFDTNNTNIT